MEKLIAQWPGALGVILIGGGLYMCMRPPFFISPVALCFALGIASPGYWGFADGNG